MHLLGAGLAAPGSATPPGRVPATGNPAPASDIRASRLHKARRFPRLCPRRHRYPTEGSRASSAFKSTWAAPSSQTHVTRSINRAPAWSKCPPVSAQARLLHPPQGAMYLRRAALRSAALPGREAGLPGTPSPLPRVLEPSASKTVGFTAVDHLKYDPLGTRWTRVWCCSCCGRGGMSTLPTAMALWEP